MTQDAPEPEVEPVRAAICTVPVHRQSGIRLTLHMGNLEVDGVTVGSIACNAHSVSFHLDGIGHFEINLLDVASEICVAEGGPAEGPLAFKKG